MPKKELELINLLKQGLGNGKMVSLDFDLDGNFYINQKQIATRNAIFKLRGFELFILSVTAIAVVIESFMSVISYFFPLK